MLISLLISLLVSNAVTLRRDKSILFSRFVITGLLFASFLALNNLFTKALEKGIGIYGGLFNVTTFTQSFNIFIFLISAVILVLTAFYPRKVFIKEQSSFYKLLTTKLTYNKNTISNKTSEQFRIIEYALIIVFILCGAVFLMSTADLISVFLSIELQSYGLYILSTLYRDSESATASGLTYFLLGGLSSCFILLGSALLYVNSGTTNLDNIYVISSISEIEDLSSLTYWYQPYYLHLSLIILSVGFLFKVSAAPFHFWSPKKGLGKSLSTNVGSKLSNSGEALKLLVLNHIWKYMSGWTNYSGIVTSQKISESEMGNRGSKSAISRRKLCIAVKEQRVNGSWCDFNLSHLRCTLLGFERSYLIKIPSNQIIQKQFYSTVSNLDSGFISGFTDAEGCFLIIIRKAPKNLLGWQLEVSFTINLHVRDLDLLNLIKTYFEVGRISKERNGCCDFTISSLDQIITKVIPHFDKYPLKTQKYSDYLLFKEVVFIMQRKEHLTAEGLQKIVNIRASLNKGLSYLLLEAFPNTVALARPLLPPLSAKLDPEWVAGFTSGDGCFKVSIREYKSHKTVSRVALLFVVTQHIRGNLLLKSLVDFFGCGQTYSYKDYIEFRCQSFKDNYEKIIPFFNKYPIIGVKSKDFEDWAKIAKMIERKVHLTNQGFDQIRLIRKGMNKGRYKE